MHGTKVLAALAAAASLAAQVKRAPPAGFSGESALNYTRRIVAFGPRPVNSEAIHTLQGYILAELKPLGCQVVQDDFKGDTPLGLVPMKNIIARFPGSSGRALAVTGHYDTKSMPGIKFVGANDGGASAGFLLEMARVVSHWTHKDDVYLVWFDGEEAIGPWSATDGVYGSRHLAARWGEDGTARKIKALINVDMIGDKGLGILQEMYSSSSLRRLVWQTAQQLGYSANFLNQGASIEDDHAPFLAQGVNALDLIDFDYGPDNSWWHTEQDTLDKLSARSLQVVGSVVFETLKKLDGGQ